MGKLKKLSGKQKRAVEKIAGRHWDTWHLEALSAYFAFTDRGEQVTVSEGAQGDFKELLHCHHWHSITVELWKKDFRVGLLFLDDFIGQSYPDAYIGHAFEVYQEALEFIPRKYEQNAGLLRG